MKTAYLFNLIAGAARIADAKKEIENLTVFMPDSIGGNAKLGYCASVYSPKTTCPIDCPFKDAGCYARTGHCNLWFDVAGGKKYRNKYYNITLEQLKNKVATLNHNIIIRHNVSGDLCTSGNDINPALLLELVEIYKGHKAYTYTHADKNPVNLALCAAACRAGFTVNASCENVNDVEKAVSAHVPAVLAVETMPDQVVKKNGIIYTKCPAAEKGTTCGSCTMCSNCDRKNVVVFPVHGNDASKAKAKKAGFLIKEFK